MPDLESIGLTMEKDILEKKNTRVKDSMAIERQNDKVMPGPLSVKRMDGICMMLEWF